MSTRSAFLIGIFAVLFASHHAWARCRESVTYRVEFEVVSCKKRGDFLDKGAIIEARVLSKARIEHAGTVDTIEWWWPDVTKPVEAHYDSSDMNPCSHLPVGSTKHGIIGGLCCDGGEPRCSSGIKARISDITS